MQLSAHTGVLGNFLPPRADTKVDWLLPRSAAMFYCEHIYLGEL